MLSGIYLEDRNIFWTTYVGIMLCILTIALGSMTVKKMIEKFKEYKIQRTIHVNIQMDQLPKSPAMSVFNFVEQDKAEIGPPLDQINNKKHNVPILSGFEMAVFGYVSLARIIAFSVASLIYGDSDALIPHKIFLVRKVSFSFFFSFLLPIMYLYRRKDVRKFVFLKIVPNLYCYIRFKKKPKRKQSIVTI